MKTAKGKCTCYRS